MLIRPIASAGIGVILLAALILPQPADARAVDPLTLYGSEIEFDVFRSGSRIGTHVVRFKRDRDALRVRSTLSIAIRFLGMSVYGYRYESQARWRRGQLVSLDVRVDDDGARHEVRARSNGRGLIVDGPDGQIKAATDVFPTNHWHPAVVTAGRVLNTLTGRVNAVQIVDLGPTVVETADGRRAARHYRYTGELEAEVWYDGRGRWVKLRFQGKDGSTIEYVCRLCGDA